jgi:hypothetical protein
MRSRIRSPRATRWSPDSQRTAPPARPPRVPAADRQVTMTATVIYRIENGKIAEKWPDKDALGFL